MVITPEPQLEAAQKRGTTVEEVALEALRQKFLPTPSPFEPRDEWERRLLALSKDCGVALPDSAFLGEELYLSWPTSLTPVWHTRFGEPVGWLG